MILLSYMLDLHLTSLFSTSVPNWNISIWTLTLTLTLPPPPPWLLNNLCLLLSLFFFLVFNHSRSYVCFWLTLQSTSYIPPSHPRPFTKQRKSAPSESYTNSSDKKDQKFKRKGNRGYLEPNSPMVQPNERTNATFETFAFCDNIQNLSFLRAV